MRMILALAVFTIVATAGREAKAGPYCAVYSDGALNCGFPSMWACRASISGVGGNCSINPREYPYLRDARGRRAYYDAAPCRLYPGFGRRAGCER